MEQILPIVIICAIGIVACLAYILTLCVKAIRRRPPRKHQFEIEEDVLTIKLRNRRKK